jgi:chromosome segregation ATPase
MTETILSLNKEVKNLQQSLATSSELNENLRKKITDMQQICEASVANEAETAKRSAEKEIEMEKAKCTKTIAEAERKFERDVQSYKDALAAAEIISEKNQKMREEIESQLECDKNKHEELKRKINLLNNELAAAQRNLSEEQAHSLVLRENLAALSGKAPDISKMQGEKRDTEAQLAADKGAIAAFEKEIATLKNEKSTLKNENSALNKVLASESAVSIDQHRKVRDALEKQLEQEKSKLNDLITESNKEKELIGREVSVLKNELAAAKHTIGTLQSEIVNIRPGSSAEDTGKVDGQIDTQSETKSESLWGLNGFQLLDRAMKKVGGSTTSSDPSPSHQGEKKDTEASVSLFSTRGWGGPAQEEKKETEAQLAAAQDVIIAALEKEIETLKNANAVDPKFLDVLKKIQEWVAKVRISPLQVSSEALLF